MKLFQVQERLSLDNIMPVYINPTQIIQVYRSVANELTTIELVGDVELETEEPLGLLLARLEAFSQS